MAAGSYERKKSGDLLVLGEALHDDSRLALWAKCEERNFFARTFFFPSVQEKFIICVGGPFLVVMMTVRRLLFYRALMFSLPIAQCTSLTPPRFFSQSTDLHQYTNFMNF
jgi:hypothetical protein